MTEMILGEATAAARTAALARLEKVVDAAALRHNVRVLRAAAGGRRMMAVIKGDAYGLGARAISDLLLGAGVDALAVDTVAEGVDLRDHGVEAPIIVMDVDVADNADICVDRRLIPSVAAAEQVDRYARIAARRGSPVEVWLRTNVGFNRFGPRDEPGFEFVLERLREERSRVGVRGIFAHLSSAAGDAAETAAQAKSFQDRAARARVILGHEIEVSLAGTHGLLHPIVLDGTTWVRPGIGLYGLLQPECRELPGWRASGLDRLRPAVTVRARVLDLVVFPWPEGIGYDRSTVVPAGRRVATVAIGFSRGLAGATELTGLLRGSRCPMIGRPGMDCAQFDVTNVPDAVPGDWMTFLGADDGYGGVRNIEEMCAQLGCSRYELLAILRMPVRVSGE
jgi:alanine racemase